MVYHDSRQRMFHSIDRLSERRFLDRSCISPGGSGGCDSGVQRHRLVWLPTGLGLSVIGDDRRRSCDNVRPQSASTGPALPVEGFVGGCRLARLCRWSRFLQNWTLGVPWMGGVPYANGNLGPVAQLACLVHAQGAVEALSQLMNGCVGFCAAVVRLLSKYCF